MRLMSHRGGIISKYARKSALSTIIKTTFYRLKYRSLGTYIAYSQTIPGWTRGREAVELARVCMSLPPKATVVEIGSFLGSGSVLLAGARKIRGSGVVHCIDPFNASGDAYSVPYYRSIADEQKLSLRESFERNLKFNHLDNIVRVHQGTAEDVDPRVVGNFDMMYMDGDQSPKGVRIAYERWSPFLNQRGIIALHNSGDREYSVGHDGHRRLVVETIHPPQYINVYCVGSTTFARKDKEEY